MHEAVKEGYGGEEGYEGEDHFFSMGDFWGARLDLQRGEWSLGVGRFSTGALVCWRFWARGPGYPYDILELGSYLVGKVELGFGQCLHSAVAVNKASEQTKVSIRTRYLNLCIVLFFYKIY
jgi:hypothetical protein